MKKRWIAVTAAIAALLCIATAMYTSFAYADEGLSVEGKSAMLMDYDTGAVVYEKNANDRLPIASMVKIMTLNLIFDEIDAGRLTLDTEIVAGENATKMGGSQAFLDTNNSYRTDELIKSIVVASANDSCVAMAEHIAGSIESFVARMNERAAVLGMTDTHFVNCTGLPAPGQYSCAADVAKMSRALFARPVFYTYANIWMYDFAHPSGRTTSLTNTNKLVRFYEGCDGGKTGFTSEALSCLSATAKRGETRLISIVIGAPDAKKRNAEIVKLFNYGFANYETTRFVTAGSVAEAEAIVENGKPATVKGIAASDLVAFRKKGKAQDYTVETVFHPLSAPVAKNAVIGEIVLFKGGERIGAVDLLAAEDIHAIGFLDIIGKITQKW